MEESRIYNVNITAIDVLPTPAQVKAALPISERAEKNVFEAQIGRAHV